MNSTTEMLGVPAAQDILQSPSAWALVLDIDGTLLEMAPVPDAVVVPPDLPNVLSRLEQTFGGAVALSTGRRVEDADNLFAPLQLTTCGVHGTEARLLPDGEIITLVAPVPERLLEAVNEIALAAPGVLVEPKGVGIAVHYRNALDARPQLVHDLTGLLTRYDGFRLHPGRSVLEIIPFGYSKGTALDWLMTLAPFKGRKPIMIGDDAGDEPALVAAKRHGGYGLKVAGEHFPAADADFGNISQVRSWLGALADPSSVLRAGPARSMGAGRGS